MRNYQKNLLLSTFLLTSVLAFAQRDSSIAILADRKLSGNKVDRFLDSLRSTIIRDTTKFSRADLLHLSIGTFNKKEYSPLYVVDQVYSYKLDIIPGELVKQFLDNILTPKVIQQIDIFQPGKGASLFGTLGDNGVIYIKMRKRKYNPFVAGLTRKGAAVGGDNFDQRKDGEFNFKHHK